MPRPIPALLLALVLVSGCSTAMKAGQALSEKDYPTALILYQEALKKEPGSLYLQNRIGLTHLRMKDYGTAQTVFEQVLVKSPKDPFATLYLGLCFIGKSERAKGLDQVSAYSVPFKFYQGQAVVEEAEKLRARPDLANDVVIQRIEEALERGIKEQEVIDSEKPQPRRGGWWWGY